MKQTKEVGIQCELLVSESQATMTSIAIQTAYDCPHSDDISDIGTPTLLVDILKPNSDVSFFHTQPSTSAFAENISVSEEIFPQKSISSEFTCTGSDIDSDDIYMPGSSAESQDETDPKSDQEAEKSPAEQRKFIVFEENLDKLFVACSTCFKPNAEVSKTLVGSMEEAEECKNLKSKGVKVRCLTTNRHTTITSEMRKKHSKIKHQYDIWHLSKWVVKKLAKKSKKESQDLTAWIWSVSSHFWWSVATCNGNYDVLLEKWTSIVNHVSNKHSWRGAMHFKKCAHRKLPRQEVKEKVWLKVGSATRVALQEVVFNKKLLKDLKMVTEFHHTGNLEVYHSMMLKYCPKRQHLGHKGMIAKTQFAALDHNHNCSRKQAVVKHGSSLGSLRYNLVFPKARKTWVVKPIKEEKSYDHLDALMESIMEQKISKGKRRKNQQLKTLHVQKSQKNEQKLKHTLVDFNQNSSIATLLKTFGKQINAENSYNFSKTTVLTLYSCVFLHTIMSQHSKN